MAKAMCVEVAEVATVIGASVPTEFHFPPTPSTVASGGPLIDSAALDSSDSSCSESSGEAVGGSPRASPKDRMPPRRSFVIVLMFELLVVTGMAIIYPTALSYSEELGDGATFSGLMVAVFPLSTIFGTYPLQKLMERLPIKHVFFLAVVGNVVGNVLYACAGLTHSKYVLLLARVLLGLAGQNLPVMVYVAKTVGLNHRSWAMMVLYSVIGAGYVLGPFLAFLTGTYCKELRIDNLVVDQNTLPGWLMAGLWFILLVVLPLIFTEPMDDGSSEDALLVGGTKQDAEREERPRMWVITFLMFLQIVGAMSFSLWEVFTAAHSTRIWGWTDATAGLYMSIVMAAVFLVCVFFTQYVLSKYPDRKMLLSCSAGAALSSFFCFDFALPEMGEVALFAFGSFLMLACCQLFRGSTNALCSKVVPNSMQTQMSSWTSLSCCIGRGFGPLLAAQLGIQAFAATNLGVMVAACAGTALLYAHLKPHSKAV